MRWCSAAVGARWTWESADYTVVLRDGDAFVLYADIERSRVESEECFEELGYQAVPFP